MQEHRHHRRSGPVTIRSDSPSRHGPRGRAFFSIALLLAPILLLGSIYLGTFLFLAHLHAPFDKWNALISVGFATLVTVFVYEQGKWRLGVFVSPRIAARDFALGTLFAAALIGMSDMLILATTGMRHARGTGFPWLELATVFVPAALHEELLFRGYVYQKLRTWSRSAAIAITAVVFALLHGGNSGVTELAMVNIVLAGVLLALAYDTTGRLWFPIGIHLGWNVVSGPVLGYDVSGYVARSTLLVTRGTGVPWLTGGSFGIEGSVWAVVAEGIAVVVLLRSNAKCRMQNAE